MLADEHYIRRRLNSKSVAFISHLFEMILSTSVPLGVLGYDVVYKTKREDCISAKILLSYLPKGLSSSNNPEGEENKRCCFLA